MKLTFIKYQKSKKKRFIYQTLCEIDSESYKLFITCASFEYKRLGILVALLKTSFSLNIFGLFYLEILNLRYTIKKKT